jgi:hypothetical protein
MLVDVGDVDMLVRLVREAVGKMEQWRESGGKGPRPPDVDLRLVQQVALMQPFVEMPGVVPVAQSEDSRKLFLAEVFAKLTPPEPATLASGATSQAAQDLLATSRPSNEAATRPATTQPTKMPAPADAIMVVGLPAERSAFVVQRVKYTPAYEDGYLADRLELMRALYQIQLHELTVRWFDQKEIFQRTNFKLAETEKASK